MKWKLWHRKYDTCTSLQSRLQLVCSQIRAALDESQSRPFHIVSICAGDGRDLIQALSDHPHRNDVVAWLLDTDEEALARGRNAAASAGLAHVLRFVCADATLASNYVAIAPVDLVLVSGVLGHLQNDTAPAFLEVLPMLCKVGGWFIWNRHRESNDGLKQISIIRAVLRRVGFREGQFQITNPDGFAVGRACFAGKPMVLDPQRMLFEFVGLKPFGLIPHR